MMTAEAFKDAFEKEESKAPSPAPAPPPWNLDTSEPDDETECEWRTMRAAGVKAFAAGDMSAADRHFKDAMGALCPVVLGEGDAREGDGLDEVPRYEAWTRRSFAELCSCRAAVLLRQHRHGDALVAAQRALEIKEDWAKAAMQVAKARFGLGQYDLAKAATEAECLQRPPELAAQARKLRERIEKRAYGRVVSDGAPKPLLRVPRNCTYVADPAEWDDEALVLPERAKDMLAAILARCEDADAVARLDAAHARVAEDGESTREAVMGPIMVDLQSDVLHGDYGYPAGEAGVRKFGAEMRKSFRGFPDDREFKGLVDELSAFGKPRA